MSATDLIKEKVVALSCTNDAANEILDFCGDASFILIGEASHGTHDFHQYRAEITKRLIAEKGFSAIAAEADFPDAYRVNRFVRGAVRDWTAAVWLYRADDSKTMPCCSRISIPDLRKLIEKSAL